MPDPDDRYPIISRDDARPALMIVVLFGLLTTGVCWSALMVLVFRWITGV